MRAHNFKVSFNGKDYRMMGLENNWKDIINQISVNGSYVGACKFFVLDNAALLSMMGYKVERLGTKVKITK